MAGIIPTMNYKIKSIGKDEIDVWLYNGRKKESCGKVVTFPDSNGVFAEYEKNGIKKMARLSTDKKEFFSQCWNYRNGLDKSNRL